MNPSDGTGFNFWFALAFSVLLGSAGLYILLSNPGSEFALIGWLLVGIGSLFVALNVALRARHR